MNQLVCDPNQLTAYLQGELSADAERNLTEHLNQCASCGTDLERRVADAAVWEEASELLGGDRSPLHEEDPLRDREDRRSSQIDQVLAQLAPTDDPDSLGRIGGYEVTGVIGSGGMGVVLKAHDQSLDRVVAVKVMAPHLAASGSARTRFAREAKAAAAVLHPNVIAIHGVSSDESLPYLVMPYVRGASLQKRIDTEGPLPTLDILRIGAQVAAGLAAAHEQGLVHRDIKPANILLEQGVERVTITDFGLARAVDDASMTRSGVIAGTPQYMSPEQARGEVIDGRSDLFSLGSSMYAMCTGHSPFRAETSFGVLHRITHDSPRPIREINPNIPDWLENTVMKLLAKSRNDRFDTAEEVAELLDDCLAHAQHPTTTPLPQTVASLAPNRSRRPPWFKLIAAAAFAILLFAGIVIFLESGKGTLRIETNSDAKVPIRIRQGEQVVDRLTISRQGAATKLQAGNYIIEIVDENAELEVIGSQVTLKRGGEWIARIAAVEQKVASVEQKPSESFTVQGSPAIADGETDSRSLKILLQQDNQATREVRQSLFDPPIQDLELPQFQSAFESATKSYRKQGKHAIADALRKTAKTGTLDDGLIWLDSTFETQNLSPETGDVTCRQFLPCLEFTLGSQSREFVAITGVELRWSRDGWSSPDWGKIHPPITGDWRLSEILQNDETLTAEQFDNWKNTHQQWSQLVIEDSSLAMAGTTPALKYDLTLDYSGAVPEYQLSSGGEVRFRGVFMGNGFIDDTELKIMVALDGGESPKTFRAKDGDAICLVYRREIEKAESNALESE